ncbi:MFS transporter [Exophiala viscosa]|uniref:MFS transporter n=1 Tax=Exophiala viscosa TaxID=2486360 RepID=A0AAN6IE17_9EURO|nr:MFS transporter [Exophiala viscosa]
MTAAEEEATEHAADETTALLAAPGKPVPGDIEDSENGTTKNDNEDDKPLPKDQIFFLCLARLIEPIAFFCIFPFINQMIWETGEVAETDVGFYSGLIESLFSLTQMLLMIPWGRAADYWGRKPVLVSSLGGIAIATAIFGLSKTIWQMILFRCFAGIFGGTIVTIRTMISENSTDKTQARAFSFFAFTGNLGILLGPIIGGALSRPATEYPRVFGRFKFFHDYPYALATFASGAIGAIATITSATCIKETLVRKPESSEADKKPPMSTLELLRAPSVPITLYIYAHVMTLAFSYTAICPVFLFTPVHLGGFGLTPLQISMFMAITGLSQALWLLLAFPWLQARMGTAGVMRLCATAYPFFFVILPCCNLLLRRGLTAVFLAVVIPSMILGSGVAMSFTAIQLVLNDVSPSPAVLGTLNAVALTLISGMRAFSPALFASLFAASVRSGVLGGHLIWILMVALALGFTIVSRWTPEKEKMAKNTTDSDE